VPEFFKVVTPDQVFQALSGFSRLGIETVPLDEALRRVCGRDITAEEDLPPLPRSTMDGYAVRAADTFGASDSIPAFFDVAGSVAMGRIPGMIVGRNQAVAIPTGGFLPEGADAVVMVEYTSEAGKGGIEVARPVTAGENVLGRAEDVATGECVIPAGTRLLPQEIGLLAGLGIVEVPVYRNPRVAVISTGDEIVPVTDTPLPGRIRDINTHSIAALARDAGAEVDLFAIVPDDPAQLKAAVEKALAYADIVVLSGRDHPCARRRHQPGEADPDRFGGRQSRVRAPGPSGFGARRGPGVSRAISEVSWRGTPEARPGRCAPSRPARRIGALGPGTGRVCAGPDRGHPRRDDRPARLRQVGHAVDPRQG
jgi:molybdopterin molybdotransferase